MEHVLRCPRCQTRVHADWPSCPTCGFEPTRVQAAAGAATTSSTPAPERPPPPAPRAELDHGPHADPASPPTGGAPPRNVFDPEQHGRVHPLVGAALGVAALVLIGAILVGIVTGGSDGGGDATTSPISLGADAEDRATTDLGDGWWRLDLGDGELVIEIPGPLARTRATFPLAGQVTEMPASAWVGGRGADEIHGVVVGEPPPSWDRSPESLLADVELTVGGEVIGGTGERTEVAGRPALRRRTVEAGVVTTTTTIAADDELLILVVRARGADADDVLGRMEATLQLG